MASLFSVEGIEASGKTTVVTGVTELLRLHDWNVELLGEFVPTGRSSAVDEALARSLFVSEGFRDGPRAAFFFMLYHEAAKLENARNGPAADVVIADRYIDSVTVYQGSFLPGFDSSRDVLPLARATENLLGRVGLPLPAVSYLLDIPLELAAERYRRRERKELDTRERERIGHLRRSFLELARDNDRFRVVDGSKPSRDVVGAVFEDIVGRLTGAARP